MSLFKKARGKGSPGNDRISYKVYKNVLAREIDFFYPYEKNVKRK